MYEQVVAAPLHNEPERLVDLVHYAVTEMFNNALEHAQAGRISLQLFKGPPGLAFELVDDGIGCFENVRATHELADLHDAIGQLSKGKVTTMPEAHSGEGIFFTSKAATRFVLESNGLCWTVDNERHDTAIAPTAFDRGTRIEWFVEQTPRRSLERVFREHATEALGFDKTSVRVRLFERGEVFMSRSEAKRVLAGLHEFREVIFDFDGVRSVGQGFADEIFRVFAHAHREIRLVVAAANDSIEFMIRRSAPDVEFVASGHVRDASR